jgi:hypothetical protein
MRGISQAAAQVLIYCGLVSVSIGQTSTEDSFNIEDRLKANGYDITVTNGNLAGPGLEFLLKATSSAQFVAVGEPHNAKEVPELTTLLFNSLHKHHGYNYLALEQDPVMARMVSEPPVVGNREHVVSLANKYPNAFTFITDQDLEMIWQAGEVSGAKGNRIWGLDQVFGPIHVLDRLSKFAPNVDVRRRTQKLIEVLRQNEVERVKKLERYTMANVGDMEELQKLLSEYQPKKGSEAEFLVSQMMLSARVYKNNRRAGEGQITGFDSNYEREENMKSLFMLEYRKAQSAGERSPKVLLKFGHYHSIRGRSWSNVLSLGNFVSEFAKSNGMDSFHLSLYINNASGKYGVLSSYSDFKPLADAAPHDKWTVIDLRPLRNYAHAGKLTGLNPEMRRIIFGFDAVLMIGGGSPGTYKLMGVQ